MLREKARENGIGGFVMNKGYKDAVQTIKAAILQSQYEAVKNVNACQLMLYFEIGKYISLNSRNGYWGQGAIDAISEQLEKEMPGLKGFSARNLRYMRTFYEEWSSLDANVSIGNSIEKVEAVGPENVIEKWNPRVPNLEDFPIEDFWGLGFTLHRTILGKCKDYGERIFYIKKCANERYSREQLVAAINADEYHHQGNLPNNFSKTLSPTVAAFKAINTFKDEYLLDYINVEELDVRDSADVDEKVVENGIVNDIKKFILTFGKDFAFVGNQFHLDAFGEDQYIDLLFFNRELNCLVAVELKKGKFKPSYLGQLQGYLSILDGFEKKAHENPSIGIILCKDMNKSFVDYVIRDYSKPIGVATYKTSKDMSDQLKRALPAIEDLQKLLDEEEDA